ncbi:MAG: hypothetical protein NXI30_02500 [bacterium]|nr:hypothetical protein [bacterium]
MSDAVRTCLGEGLLTMALECEISLLPLHEDDWTEEKVRGQRNRIHDWLSDSTEAVAVESRSSADSSSAMDPRFKDIGTFATEIAALGTMAFSLASSGVLQEVLNSLSGLLSTWGERERTRVNIRVGAHSIELDSERIDDEAVKDLIASFVEAAKASQNGDESGSAP